MIFEFFPQGGDGGRSDGLGGVSPFRADVGEDGGDFPVVERGSLGRHHAVPFFTVDEDFSIQSVEDGENNFFL